MGRKKKPLNEIKDEYVRIPVPKGLVREMDKLIEKGLYRSRSEIVRESIRMLLLIKSFES